MDREQLIKQMTDYVINVLEERRPEFSGFAVCPFVKADRLADQLHLDVFDNTKDTLVDVVLRFVRSGKRSALIGQPNVNVKPSETKGYQEFINIVLEEMAMVSRRFCFNPNTKMEVKSFLTSILLSTLRTKDLGKRTALSKTKYYTNCRQHTKSF